jgi:3-oxoadipate enol-lactonase
MGTRQPAGQELRLAAGGRVPGGTLHDARDQVQPPRPKVLSRPHPPAQGQGARSRPRVAVGLWRRTLPCGNVRRMPTAAVNGIQVSYADSGGDGPAVVLGHGYLMDASMFDAQVAALAPGYRVITWDARGHGGTPAPGPFSYWDLGRDVLALLDHLGIEQAVLGGMSQGGFLSLRAALLAPRRVRGLVLIDSQAGTELEASRPGYEQMHQMWLDQGPGPVQEIVAAIILGPGRWDSWYAKWAEQYAQWAPDNLGQLTWPFRCLMDRDDLTGRLGEVTCPALIVHGSEDAAIPLARAEEMRDGLAGPTTFTVIDGAPHASNVTHPGGVNAAVENFLHSLAG